MKEADLKEIAESFFKPLDDKAKIEIEDRSGPEEKDGAKAWWINVESTDSGQLIGKMGETLSAIQYLIRLMVSQKFGEFLPITVDVDKYKSKKEDDLKELAIAMAENVKSSGYAQEMRPMGAYERRIIHVILKDFPGVKSDSIGEGELRRIKIEPTK